MSDSPSPAGAAAPLSRSAAWRAVGFLAVAAAVNYADRAAFSAVLPPLRAELRLSDTELGLIGSVFLWTYALTSPVAGSLGDRVSRRGVVLASLLLWSVVTAFTGFANGLVSLCLFRGLLGIFESLYHPAAFALVADHHAQAARGRAMSALSIGFQLGVVAGGAVAGYLADAFSWRVGFWCLGAVGIALALFASRLLPPTPARAATRTATPPLQALRYLSAVPTFYILLLKSMLTGITTWIFFAWLPLYLQETFQLTLGAAGFAGTFMLQATKVAGILCGGWISDRFSAGRGERRLLVLAACYLCAAPFLLTFLTKPGFFIVSLAIAAFSLFGGMGLASEQPTLAEVVPSKYRSTAIGVSNTFATAAGGLGVLLAGVLKARVGLHVIFAASCAIYLITAAFIIAGYFRFTPADIQNARAAEANNAAS